MSSSTDSSPLMRVASGDRARRCLLQRRHAEVALVPRAAPGRRGAPRLEHRLVLRPGDDGGAHRSRRPPRHREEHVALAGDVAVERALGHAGGPGDLIRRDVVEAAFDEEPQRRFLDPPSDDAPPAVPRPFDGAGRGRIASRHPREHHDLSVPRQRRA
jgi:hypothetical protein